jgi:hypothetical protein
MRWVVFTLAGLIVVAIAACGGDDRLSQQEYGERINKDVSEVIMQSFDEMRRKGDEVIARPALVRNDAWRQEFSETMDGFDRAHQNMQGLKPPEGFNAAHTAMLRATECFSDAAQDIETGVLEQSLNALETGMFFMQSCVDLLGDARVSLEAALQ